MGLNFTDSLNTDTTDVERPPLLPQGVYRWVVEKPAAMDSVGKDGQFDVCDFQLRCIDATESVDADEVREFIQKAGQLNNVRRRLRFMFDKEDEGKFKASMFRLKDFVQTHLGVGEFRGTMKELLAAAVNQQCLGTIKWRVDKDDPERFYDEISKTAPVA